MIASTKMPGTLTSRAGVVPGCSHSLHLGDDHAARVMRGLRHRERVADERLAFHRQIAGFVRGGRADNRHIYGKRRIEEELSPMKGDQFDQVVWRAADCRPPPWRGSTNEPSPTWVIRPGLPAAISRQS